MMNSLTQQIKRKALELGFSKVGIARAERLEEERDNLLRWLELGYHGTMKWMKDKPERRCEPSAPNQSVLWSTGRVLHEAALAHDAGRNCSLRLAQ